MIRHVDPAELARRVSTVPGVARLRAGRFGEVATYLANGQPGEAGRVDGIRVRGTTIEVHVVAEADVSLVGLAEEVRTALRQGGATDVDVVIEDVEVPRGVTS